jgi:UDPglucose 6-dehydrogenase
MSRKNGKTVVGIMGVGVVGDAVRSYFEKTNVSLRLYDPGRGLGSLEEINQAQVVFLCVPTPYHGSRGFDDSAVEDAVSRLEGSKVVVIKSTVLPGTTEAYQVRYSQHCFLFNPEFLREVSAREDFLQSDRQLVGYTAQSRHLAEWVLGLLPKAPYARVMGAREAEMTKYMTNTFLALKVTFANEIYDLCAGLDIDYEHVRDAVAADARIGASHLSVMDAGYRGYGGKCLPKDTKALLQLSDRMGVPLRLLRTADRVNETLLPPSAGQEPLPIRPSLIAIGTDADASEAEERVA